MAKLLAVDAGAGVATGGSRRGLAELTGEARGQWDSLLYLFLPSRFLQDLFNSGHVKTLQKKTFRGLLFRSSSGLSEVISFKKRCN